MIKKVGFLILCYVLAHAEPSAFELQGGATKDDISSLQSSSKNLQNIVASLQNRLANLEQIQGGFTSIVSGQNLKLKNMSSALTKMQNQIQEFVNQKTLFENSLKEGGRNVDALKAQVLSQQEDIRKLQKSIQELNRIMTESNNSIIQQLSLMSQFLEKTQSQKTSTEEQQNQARKDSAVTGLVKSKKNDEELFNDAKSFVQKKNLDQAEELFNSLLKKDYKSAEVNYQLGEIAFGKKDYKKAIEFYKKSAILDDKASYMPVLLWRTAWSFKAIKDDKNYQKFVDLLIRLYPNSDQAVKAVADRTVRESKTPNPIRKDTKE